jgi:hypothetical protein
MSRDDLLARAESIGGHELAHRIESMLRASDDADVITDIVGLAIDLDRPADALRRARRVCNALQFAAGRGGR